VQIGKFRLVFLLGPRSQAEHGGGGSRVGDERSAHRGYLSISEVLAQLRADFPDIRISKIRFLEAEGLIERPGAPSGYRRFDASDVERLRFILTAQRDQYLPAAGDQGAAGRRAGRRRAARRGPPGSGPHGPGPLLTRRELLDRAGITEPQLTELESFGLLRRAGRLYGPDALEVAATAAALGGYGVQPGTCGPSRPPSTARPR